MTYMPGAICITDHLETADSKDLSDAIQAVIDANPNRTIWFPDGKYMLSKPICTPADPTKSVDLVLSRYAIIKASPDWEGDEALVRLGGKNPYNSIGINGSNYSLTGGIIDGSGVANGISIDSGRETRIQDCSIKYTKVGIHIKRGANNGSSDADVLDVHIVGNGAPDSIGVLVEGYDNSFTNMRIANVQIGVYLKSGGNFLRHLHPLYTCDWTHYADSRGFLEDGFNNFYQNCYSDQFAVGFHTTHGRFSTFDSCFALWYSPKDGTHTAFRADGKFGSVLNNFNVGFAYFEPHNVVLSVGEDGGEGILQNPIIHGKMWDDQTHLDYLVGKVLG